MRTITATTTQPIIAYIADFHGDKNASKKAITYLKEHPVHLVVLGGDIPDFSPNTLTTQLRLFLKLNVPIIVFPGSHENSENYEKTMKVLGKEKNLINGVKERKIIFNTYDLLIIPGSNSVSSGDKPYNGGTYKLIKTKSPATTKKLTAFLKERKVARKVSAIVISDTTKQYNRTKSSIVFTHIPLACKTNRGIDVANFGTFKHTFTLTAKDKRKTAFTEEYSGNYSPDVLVNYEQAKTLKEHGYPVHIKKENVGSTTLRKFALKKGVRAYICGHIHESGPRAINEEEKTVRQNVWSKKVFINSGAGNAGHLTLLTLNEKGEVKYKFIKF